MIGIVTNNNDPEGLSRVKVKFPTLSDGDESSGRGSPCRWPATIAASYFPLAVDDEVLVIFGHLREPFIVGALWNGQDKPPRGDAQNRS